MLFGIGLMATLLLAWVIFRVIVRKDYLRGGSLSLLSTGLEFLIFAVHANLPYLYLQTPWPLFPPLPSGQLQIILGLTVVAVGLLTTLAVMAQLSYRTTLGNLPAELRRTGLYRWSRNPQLLSYGLMLGGCVILYPSWQAIAWLVLYGAIALLMVQTEEEHLHNLFGAEFEDYCRQTPRFFPLPGKGGILFERPKD
jgi:protein-S-isoprenylcysteine O-methyltransferase Ste14